MAAEILADASRAADANNSPLPGAKWLFYASGTSTPQNVYADAALTTSLGSEVEADAGGRFPPIYFNAMLQYRGVLKDANGTTLPDMDIDPINAGVMSQLGSSGGAASIGTATGNVQSDLDDGTKWQRKNTERASLALSADISLPTGYGYVGKGAAVELDSGFTSDTPFVVTNNTEIGGMILDGTNSPAPTANWGSGRPKGGAVFGTGTNQSTRISHITFSGRYENFKNGAINLEYVDDVDSPGARFLSNQTAYNDGAGYVTCADVTGYYGKRWNLGVMVGRDYGLKGFNLANMERSHFAGFITEGGQPFFASVQFHGGRQNHVGFTLHDGSIYGGAGYGEKVVGTKQFHQGPSIYYKAQEGVQAYGAQARYASIDSEEHERGALLCDAYQSRDDVSTAELDVVVHGEVRAPGKTYTSGTTQNGVTIRGDNTRLSQFTGDGATTVFTIGTSPSGFSWSVVTAANLRAYVNGILQTGGTIGNGIQSVAGNDVTLAVAPANNSIVVILDYARICPIRQIRIEGELDVSLGYSGVLEVRTPYSWIDRVVYRNIRARSLASGGYVAFHKGRDIDLFGADIDNSVRQGMIFYTDAMNRGGTFRAMNIKHDVSTSWNSEPLLRLGYTGTGQFSEAGWNAIQLANCIIDGNNDATYKAISIHGHRGDFIRHISLRDIAGQNMGAAEQIYIDLSGNAAGTVVLDILGVELYQTNGSPCTININDPNGAVYAGYIDTNCTFSGTGRPAECWPKTITTTKDLSAVAAGATSTTQTATVTGLTAGDLVDILPATSRVSIPEVWVHAANTVGFIVTNRTAANLDAAESFTLRYHRRNAI